MSTLAVVEAILREAAMPLSVREIVERAGDALPTKSKTPDTVVARDLSMDIKKKADGSIFVRTSPGRYAIREQTMQRSATEASQPVAAPPAQPVTPVTPPPATPVATLAGTSPAPAGNLTDGTATPLVGQNLPLDRQGTRPAPLKTQSNSEDTPLSA
jgi:hypothetical protein